MCSDLHLSVHSGDLKLIKSILDSKVDINGRSKGGVNVFDFMQSRTVGKFLLENKADINNKSVSGTSLHIAIVDGDTDKVKFLLENKADVNIKDRTGLTALELAEKEKFKDISLLIQIPQAPEPQVIS